MPRCNKSLADAIRGCLLRSIDEILSGGGVHMKALGIAVLAIAALAAAVVADHHFLGTAYPELPEWAQPAPLPPAAVGVNRIAAHASYALALTPDHRLFAWGGNGSEGFPGGDGRSVATAMLLAENLADWRSISAGRSASYAVSADGALWRRSMRARHDGGTVAYRRLFPAQEWIKVQSRLDLTVGLATDGTLHAWHEWPLVRGVICPRWDGFCVAVTDDGALSEGPYRAGPTGVSQSGEWETVRPPEEYPRLLGRSLAWAIPEPGPWSDFCVTVDELGRDAVIHALDAGGKPWRIELRPRDLNPPFEPQARATPMFPPVPFQRVSCSGAVPGTVMLLDREQRLWGYGDNREAALSADLKEEQSREKIDKYKERTYRIEAKDLRQLSPRRWVMVAPGPGYTAAIAGDGSLWAWGEGYQKGILNDHAFKPAVPVRVDAEREWVEVAAGGPYLVARDAQGHVHTWGSTENGEATGLLADGGIAARRERPRPILLAP